MSISLLRSRYPYPVTRPSVPTDDHGWLTRGTAFLLKKFLNDKTRVVVELGSWLGRSTRYIATRAPNATIITVDHWKGNSDYSDPKFEVQDKLPKLYDTFVTNCWDIRTRIIPMKRTTIEGLKEVAYCKIFPDVIYLDAANTTESLYKDLEIASLLFPTAQIIGNDWKLKDPTRHGKHYILQKAIEQYCTKYKKSVVNFGNGWYIEKK